jgi:hypothetical protein
LDTVGPYRLDHCFVYEEFVLEGEAGFFANEPVELGSFVVHLFAFPEYVWTPGEFAIQSHPKVCDLIRLLYDGLIETYLWAGAFAERKCRLGRFSAVDFDFPFVGPQESI